MPMIQLTQGQLTDLLALATRGACDLGHYLSSGNLTADAYSEIEADCMKGLYARSGALLETIEDAPQKSFVVSFNHDYSEWLTTHNDLDGALRQIRTTMEIDEDIHDPDFVSEVNETYESHSWKGLSIYEVDWAEGTTRTVDPAEIQSPMDSAA